MLVHCKMGISRSASTVIAFAMKYFQWSMGELHFVQGGTGSNLIHMILEIGFYSCFVRVMLIIVRVGGIYFPISRLH